MGVFLGIFCAASGRAYGGAEESVIDVKLPYSIAYTLAPIDIDVTAKGGGAGLCYYIYDTFKKELAHGGLKEGMKKSIKFKPPRYGWYVVECGTYEKDHMTSGTAKFIGVTPKYPNMHTLEPKESPPSQGTGWNDEAMQAFTGLLLDRTNTRMGWDNAERVVADAKKYGVTVLMQFEGEPSADQAKEAVTRFKGRVKYWELVNEPNFTMSPGSYAQMVKHIYPVIKSVDPDAVVMGVDTCGIMPGWLDAFYKAGGGKYLDVISFHDYEGNEGIDPFHWNAKLSALRNVMAQYGDTNKPIWQTERAISGMRYWGYIGVSQAIRISLQRDILETWGVSNDHNNHYYVNVSGYDDVPTFVYSGSGPHQAALVCRTRAAMIRDLKFVEKLDLGPTGNNILLGLRYEGDSGKSITLRNYGCLDLPVEVNVTGGGVLEVVDAFGNKQSVPVMGGKAVVTVSQWPSYLRPAKGQQVTIPPLDFGSNLAAEATFTYSGGTKSPSSILTDGIFQDNYPDAPLGADWRGEYTGKAFKDKPQTLDITFPKPREIQKVLIYGVRADNPFSAILDYDLQYFSGGKWVTIEEVRTPCPPTDLVETYLRQKDIQWYQDNNFFVHQLKRPITTDKLRMLVLRVTHGADADTIADTQVPANTGKPIAQMWSPSGGWLELREFGVYGPSSGAARH